MELFESKFSKVSYSFSKKSRRALINNIFKRFSSSPNFFLPSVYAYANFPEFPSKKGKTGGKKSRLYPIEWNYNEILRPRTSKISRFHVHRLSMYSV